MKRREFIKKSVAISSTLVIPTIGSREVRAASESPVVKVTGESPYQITKKAIELLGGMKKFISRQDIVMVKPNIGWNRTEQQAANTNPEVLKAIFEAVFNAGAKKVIVMDNPCHKAEDTYSRSGIEPMAKKMNVEVRYPDDNRLVIHPFNGENVKKWPVYKDFLEVDKFINVPILKHHGSAGLTISMKNLFGILGGRRGRLHREMGVNISDLANGFKSNLIIVDAYRVLMRNGPVGGRLSDVELKKVVIATTNTMEADVVAADLFGRQPKEVDFISEAYKKGMGQIDLKKIILKQVTV